jgi:hypothetical protein
LVRDLQYDSIFLMAVYLFRSIGIPFCANSYILAETITSPRTSPQKSYCLIFRVKLDRLFTPLSAPDE